jgi:hypothetical protein
MNLFRLITLGSGSLLLVLSYLCFQGIIPGNKICGSGCEYWWTWIIPSSRRNECLAVCVWRNALYQPFMMVGFSLIFLEFIYESANIGRMFVNWIKKRNRDQIQ